MANTYDNDEFMDKLKSFAKAVWTFCSYLFWPQKNKRQEL